MAGWRRPGCRVCGLHFRALCAVRKLGRNEIQAEAANVRGGFVMAAALGGPPFQGLGDQWGGSPRGDAPGFRGPPRWG
jgi:hypothetical protein